jgi:integrase
MASIYKHQRRYWQACVVVDGVRRRKNFPTREAAKAWARETESRMAGGHAPRLGGPAKVNVAGLLYEYAQHFTLHKEGWKQELARINRYLVAAGSPPLVPLDENDGRRGFHPASEQTSGRDLPRTFHEHRAQRAERRARTNALRARIATTRCSNLSRADIRELISTMTLDGLSASTIQKEVALLKHAFNVAAEEWNWAGLDNPCRRVRLPPASPPRDVTLSAQQEDALRAALARCENPLMLVYFELAVQTTARRKNLLRLTWSDVDFERRVLLLRKTKNGRNVPVPLTLRAMEALHYARAHSRGERILDMTEESLAAAWDRAVQRAGLPHLRVHDLRHIGTTRHACRLPNTQMLKALTGHRSDAMLARYVHFAPKDVLPFLDATEQPLPPLGTLTPSSGRSSAGTEVTAGSEQASAHGRASNIVPLRPRRALDPASGAQRAVVPAGRGVRRAGNDAGGHRPARAPLGDTRDER